MNTKHIDSKKAGLANEKYLLSLLREHGELPRAKICELANLGNSTVSYIISRLREKELIEEKFGISSSRGAQPIIVGINPKGVFTAGVEINPSGVILGIFDFNCKTVEITQVLTDIQSSPAEICATIEINLRGLLSKHSISYEKLGGVGVAVSGSISKDGQVELSSPLGWKDVPLRKMLSEKLSVPVSIRTTRVRLLAESFADPSIADSNVLYLNIADGVGSHAIIDGHLLHGATNRSGEIGHIVIDPNGPKCGCGNKGCLETFISGPAIAKKIISDIEAGQETELSKSIKSNDLPAVVISKWGQGILRNDPYALSISSYVEEKFSTITAMLINSLDPKTLILGGYVVQECFDRISAAIKNKVPENVYDSDSRDIQIRPANVGKEALAMGAARSVFQQYLE